MLQYQAQQNDLKRGESLIERETTCSNRGPLVFEGGFFAHEHLTFADEDLPNYDLPVPGRLIV
jgi:hypothetical protein